MEERSLSGDGKPREECGIYGIHGCREAANFTYLGLYSLQHRGQESAGIVSTNGERLYRYAGMGQVAQVFNADKLSALVGSAAIGHNRYSTTGASFLRNAQPIRVESHLGSFALAHNGNLVNSWTVRKGLESSGSIFQTTVDSEVIVHLMSRSGMNDFLEALSSALRQIKGAYSLLVLTRDALYAVRDPNGFRPLVYGRRADGSHVFASETCAFDISEAQYVRDIKPGELVRVDSRGMTSFFPFERTGESLCIFENIYFSRPDSMIFGASVYEMRKNLGRMLARQCPTEADAIVAVPDSSTVAALGYAEESGIPFTIGLIRSHYIGRTFIEPEQRIRDFGAKIKYNVIASAVREKRVVLVDDSIMRGTTSRKLIKMVRAAGAREVHLRISAPPTRHPCFYGIDIPTEGELIAAHHSVEEIESYLEVDSLGYLSLENAHEAMMNGRKRGWCDACFSGRYPIAVDDEKDGNQKDLFSEYLVEEIR
ncbi:MAG: amidophosphoribosyltransferase [Spirochaetales bacterium]|nr:amidophosphoribosyltransferase [Leptospiraceae bacterium]MCP5482948.1 amidophosphoribosyltransferase [Spirochaetales bacterium]MCP5484871.1 amidophosphoribosyltransferase [Spirochaetales bacterium]